MSICLYKKIIVDNLSASKCIIVQKSIKKSIGMSIELGFTKLIKNKLRRI